LIARKCSQVTGKKVYAVSSFFGQKFAELGVDGVRRWFVDEKCPGGVPAQDLLLFPAHFGGNHWVLGVIDLLKRRFEFHDSGMQLGLSNAAVRARLFVRMVKRFLTEYLPTFNSDEWTTVTPSPTSCPQQVNSIDCGVLTLMTSLYRGRGAELEYSPLQEDTTEYRRKICLSVLVGECML
jgi:Ulp1 family protease